MVYVNLYSAIVADVSNALRIYASTQKQPSFQTLFEGAKVLLCAEDVRQRILYEYRLLTGLSYLCYTKQDGLRRRHVDRYVSIGKCIWPCYDLDLQPLTLKTLSTMLVMNICGEFH